MLYIHIPFCKQKCSYCNFHFSTSLRLKEDMLLAMKKELFLRQNELKNKTLQSLYFGGGTPSILSVDEISLLIDEVLKYFDFADDIEITLEANPDDLDKTFIKQLSGSGINRLSIGTQSFFEEDLKLMNRAHNASQAESSIKYSQDFGFENISIDLIYGTPGSSMGMWKNNLQKTIDLQIPHISSYALTIEPKTALDNWISRGKTSAPKEQEQSDQFHYMIQFLKENHFVHYEISNFAKPGFHSRHNSSYWNCESYLGIGPSAHSYNGTDKRSWNMTNNQKYIKHLAENKLPEESEILSGKDIYNEMIMIGLRTMWGVDLSKLNVVIPNSFSTILQKEIKSKMEAGQLVIEDNRLKIPEKHWFFADGIASDLFMI